METETLSWVDKVGHRWYLKKVSETDQHETWLDPSLEEVKLATKPKPKTPKKSCLNCKKAYQCWDCLAKKLYGGR